MEDHTSSVVELWVLYVIGTAFIGGRLFSRYKLVGWRGFQPDDYLAIVLWGLWTAAPPIGYSFIVTAKGLHTSLLTPEQRAEIPESERAIWTYGSQMFLFGLTGYIFIVWLVKFNQLFFYRRVVRGTWVENLIYPTMGLLAAALSAIVLTIALHCVPLQKIWQVYPDPGPNCVPETHTVFTVVLSLNLLTDVCILAIPVPALISLQLPLLKKAALWLLFSLGSLCMVFAILRYVLIFKLNDTRGISALWSVREDFVAIVVGQAPMVYPLFTRRFWNPRHNKTSTSATPDFSTIGGSRHRQLTGDEYEMGGRFTVSGNRSKKAYNMYGFTEIDRSESQEGIAVPEPSHSTPWSQDGIMVERSVVVERSQR